MKRTLALLLTLGVSGLIAAGIYLRAKPYRPPDGYAIGMFGSVPLRIPLREVHLLQRSAAAVTNDRRESTCGDRINGAILFLRWPDMLARDASTNLDFTKTFWNSNGDSHWLEIKLEPWQTAAGKGQKVDHRTSLWRQRARALNIRGGAFARTLPEGVHFGYQPEHPETGLPFARPKGPRTGSNEAWNQEVHWAGLDDSRRHLSTLITCNGGTYDPPRWTAFCTQRFYSPEIQADVAVSYRKNLLRKWRHIERDLRAHLSAFRHACQTN